MMLRDWSSDVCSSDQSSLACAEKAQVCYGYGYNIPHGASTVAMFLTLPESCEVSMRQAQSASKRLIIYMSAPPPALVDFCYGINVAKIRNYFITDIKWI